MSTIWVREFTGGLDTRRMAETTQGGALIVGRDGHINRGGEFEQRAAFVKTETLLSGTVSLADGGTALYVFGHEVASNLPVGYAYQQLVHPTVPATALTAVLSYDLYGGLLYVVGKFADGTSHHYYDGVIVGDLEGGSPAAGYGPGDFARTIGTKTYVTSGSILGFSGVDTPDEFDSGATGAGFIDMAKQAAGTKNLLAVAEYQNLIAIFAARVILLWYVDPDPALNKKSQILKNTGTVAAGSVVGFGDADLFYLADSGVRSLRARDASNAAATTDIGVPIDTLVVAKLQTLTELEISRIKSVIEPTSGRYWLATKNEIFVFSFFSGSKVSAWTTYLPTYIDDAGDKQTFEIDDCIVYGKQVHLRSGNDIFVYGGLEVEPAYDATQPEAWLPFLDGGKPAVMKSFAGFDCAVEGQWEVRVALDPTNADASDKVAVVSKSTFNSDRIPMGGEATHVSLRFKGIGAGPKKISSVLVHYTHDEAGDVADA